MPSYIIRTARIDELKSMPSGGYAEISTIDFSATPEQSIDAKNMTELQTKFDSFVKSLEQCGACYRVYVVKDKRDPARKFNGFDKASSRGGPLRAIVNQDVAIAAALKNAKSKLAAA